MHRFIIEPGRVLGDVVLLSAEEARHALRVLRLSPGDAVQLSDGAGALFSGELLENGQVRLMEPIVGTEPPVQLTLYQGLPKFEKLELVCQKATELGVSRIVPVKMERCVVKLSGPDGEKRRERLHKICQEASKQCGRAKVPEVLAPVGFRQALALIRQEQLALLAWEEARGLSLGGAHERQPDAGRIGLIIGPEGGVSAAEAEAITREGALSITLGPRILRTETAAIAAGAVIMNLWGDL